MIDRKYHIYRIHYDSTVQYRDITEAVKSWSAEYMEIIGSISSMISESTQLLYCGKLANWKTFMAQIAKDVEINSKNVLEWENIIRSINYSSSIYNSLRSSISFSPIMIGDNNPISLFSKNEKLPINGISIDTDSHHPMKNIRIIIEDKGNSVVEVKYRGDVIKEEIDIDSLKKNALCKKSNSKYEWIEADLEWKIDGCNNLCLYFYQYSNLIHTQNILKLDLV
jgi:hypothetical protein